MTRKEKLGLTGLGLYAALFLGGLWWMCGWEAPVILVAAVVGVAGLVVSVMLLDGTL